MTKVNSKKGHSFRWPLAMILSAGISLLVIFLVLLSSGKNVSNQLGARPTYAPSCGWVNGRAVVKNTGSGTARAGELSETVKLGKRTVKKYANGMTTQKLAHARAKKNAVDGLNCPSNANNGRWEDQIRSHLDDCRAGCSPDGRESCAHRASSTWTYNPVIIQGSPNPNNDAGALNGVDIERAGCRVVPRSETTTLVSHGETENWEAQVTVRYICQTVCKCTGACKRNSTTTTIITE